jgi:hypothetical protein
MEHTLVYDYLKVPIGSLSVNRIQVDQWGSVVAVERLYSYPQEAKTFRLCDCRAIEWYIQVRADMEQCSSARVITRSGQANYQRTAHTRRWWPG